MDFFFACCAEEKLSLLKGDPHFPLLPDASTEAKELFDKRTECVDNKKQEPAGSTFVFPIVTLNGEKGVVCGSVNGGRQAGRLSPIGGKVEHDESYGSGLLRELSEECYGLVSGTIKFGGEGSSPLVKVKNTISGKAVQMPEVAFVGEGELHSELLHDAKGKEDGLTIGKNKYMKAQHDAYEKLELKMEARRQGKSSEEDFTQKEKEAILDRLKEKAMAELIVVKLKGFADNVLGWNPETQKDVELEAFNTATQQFEMRTFVNARVGLFNDLVKAKGVEQGLRAMGA